MLHNPSDTDNHPARMLDSGQWAVQCGCGSSMPATRGVVCSKKSAVCCLVTLRLCKSLPRRFFCCFSCCGRSSLPRFLPLRWPVRWRPCLVALASWQRSTCSGLGQEQSTARWVPVDWVGVWRSCHRSFAQVIGQQQATVARAVHGCSKCCQP